MLDKILLVDKPVGFSSFQIVRILKSYYRKVGHAGTLDPFATGLLIILIGKATKRCIEIQKNEKEYIGEIILGMVTDTYDISGRKLKKIREGQWIFVSRENAGQNFSPAHLSLEELNRTANEFTGEIEQIPPKFSAIKQGGRKLYELSRKGISVQPQKRRVFIKSFQITEFDYPKLKFNAVVGKGVYLRSLAFDFGNKLGCGATLLSLRRTRIGKYEVASAKKMGDILLSPPLGEIYQNANTN